MEVQRKLINPKTQEPVDGIIFVEYTFAPDRHPSDKETGPVIVPPAEEIDGDDQGCFCGHVYIEAMDAIDLNVDHLTPGYDPDIGLTDENAASISWSCMLETSCRRGGVISEPFLWRTMDIEGRKSCGEGSSGPRLGGDFHSCF